MFIQLLFFVLSMILTVCFFLYGFNHYYLLYASRKYQKPSLPKNFTNRPKVSVQLPVYNESYVIRRLITACAAMADTYGKENVDIKILDDSNDETIQEVDEIVDEFKQKNFNIEVLRRENRAGFKAGALQIALEKTDAEYTAIFDADFIPSSDFLVQTIPYFIQDDSVAVVQSRWTHLNRDYSKLTKAIAVGIDVHFMVEQTGRYAADCLQNFNGTGGVIRKKAIMEAGGWQSDTLAEDLDISYRMQTLGYRVVFLRDLLSPAEIPPTVPSYKKQQARWACGSLRVAKKLLAGLMRNKKLNFKQHLQTFIHLTGYMLHPLMLSSFLLICISAILNVNTVSLQNVNAALELDGSERIISLLGGSVLTIAIVLCSIAPWISMMVALKSQNLSIRQNLISMIFAFFLGFGICASNSIEAGKALLTNRVWEFTRTPKYADIQNDGDRKKSKYQVSLDFSWMLELFLICLGLFCIVISIRYSNYFALIMLCAYTMAFSFVFIFSLIQTRKGKTG